MSKNAETAVLQENEMGTLPVGKLLRKMSLPLIFSMFVQVLYGLVDSMYVAQLGDTALTAISLCMPVQYLVLGVGIGIGVGVNSILSKKLGEKDEHGVNRAAGNGFVLIWIVSVVFVIMGLFAMEPFYGLQSDYQHCIICGSASGHYGKASVGYRESKPYHDSHADGCGCKYCP